MKKLLLTLILIAGITISCAKKNPIVSGTFEGVGAGRYGDITVSVVLEDSVITGINILSSEETKSIAQPVYTDMRQTMIDNNNINVDMVSGATMTAKGFIGAVEVALKSAGVNLKGKKIPITEAAKEEAIQNYDIVVIGGGGAGFSAAIEAKNNGAEKVVLLEKLHSVGGSTLISGAGINAANTWMQKKFGIKDSEELFYNDSLKGGDNLGTPELIRYVTANADEGVTWLSNYIGVPYRTYVQQFGGHTVPRSHNPEGHSGEGMINLMKAKAEELGIDVKTGTEATELLMADGRVNGVMANKNGQEITFNASKAVIIATGGFGANVEMRTKYNAEYDKDYLVTVSPGNTGDGISMAEKLDADTVGMEHIQTYPTSNPITGEISYVANTRFNGAILVNQEGNRFVEEMGRRDAISKGILAQSGGFAYLMWNEAIGKVGDVLEGNKKEYSTLLNQKLIVKADTIEEVAKFFNISAEELKNTITKVNEYAQNKKDPDFNHRRGLVAMTEGPYYIQKVVPSIHHTMGGLKIDINAHVLDKNNKVIPGLYAAGEVTGGIHGANRLGGNAIADIVVFGRTAGKNAATGI